MKRSSQIVSVPVLAALALLPACNSRQVRENAERVRRHAGKARDFVLLEEHDQKREMLVGDSRLPPPADYRPLENELPLPPPTDEASEVSHDALPAIIVNLAERQDEQAESNSRRFEAVLQKIETLKSEQSVKDCEAEKRQGQQQAAVDLRLSALEKKVEELKAKPAMAQTPASQPVPAEVKPNFLKSENGQIRLAPPSKPVITPEPATVPEHKPNLKIAKETPSLEKPKHTMPLPFEILLGPRTVKTFGAKSKELREEARNAYRRILEKHTESEAYIQAHIGLAEMALEEGRLREALTLYRNLLEERPEDTIVVPMHLEAGKLSLELGQYAKGREHFFAFADLLPNDRRTPDALFLAAGALEADGQVQGALIGYRDILQRFGGATIADDARRALADLHYRLGQFDKAREVYEQMARRILPGGTDHIHAMMQLARIESAAERPEEARRQLDRLLSMHPSEAHAADAMYLMAETYASEGQPLDAARAFEKAAESFPLEPKAMDCRQRAGEGYAALGMPLRAIQQYRAILAQTGLDAQRMREIGPRTLLDLATAQRQSGGLGEARDTLDRIYKEFPGHALIPSVDLERAELMIAQKQDEPAIVLLDSLAKVHQGKPQALRALMRKAQLEEGRASTEDAVQTYARMGCETETGSKSAFDFRRAVYLIDLNREEEALRLLEAVEADREALASIRRQALYQRGIALERLGRLEQAAGAYEKLATAEGAAEDEMSRTARWKVEKLRWIQKLTALAGKQTPKP